MENEIKIYRNEDYLKLKEFVLPWNATRIYDLSNLANHNFLKWYYTSSKYCYLTYIEEEGKIKGIVGCERIPFLAGGGEKEILLIKDVYAEKGYGGRLIKAAMNRSKYVGGLGISLQAGKIYRHYGWKDITANLEKYKYFYRVRRNPLINFAFYLFSELSTFLLLLICFIEQRLRKVGFLESKYFTESDSEYINSAVKTYDNTPRRTVEYLNWRFNTENKFIKYKILKIKKRAKYIGYIVIGIQEEKRNATISDLLISKQDLYLSSLIIREAIQVCKKYKVKRLSMISSLPEIKHSLKINLFFRVPFEDDFMMTNYSEASFQGFWHITTGFSDMDFYT